MQELGCLATLASGGCVSRVTVENESLCDKIIPPVTIVGSVCLFSLCLLRFVYIIVNVPKFLSIKNLLRRKTRVRSEIKDLKKQQHIYDQQGHPPLQP